jgi:hypothetical protein
MDPKAAASAILRRLAVALKTYALYPPPSPVTDRAVGELLEGLQGYLRAHGQLTVRVSRRSFQVNDATFKDTTSANLAFHLYARKVIGMQFSSGVDSTELTTLLTAMRQDRNALHAAGGMAAAVREAGVRTIRVIEIVLAPGASGEGTPTGSALWELVGDGRGWAPEQRQAIVEVLRAGPAAIGGLFDQVRGMLTNAVDGQAVDWPQAAFDVIKNLDRVITAQPGDEQPEFYGHLAAAILLLEEPVRAPVERTLAAHENTDQMARFLLDRMSEQRLGQVVPRGALEDSGGQRSDHTSLEQTIAIDPEVQMAQAASTSATSSPAADALSIAYEDSVDQLRGEVEAMDDASVTREAVETFIDVLNSQTDEAETVEAIATVEEHVVGLVAQHEFRLLRAAVAALVSAAERAGVRDHTVSRLSDRLVREDALEVFVDILWTNRGARAADDVSACLVMLADGLVVPLMHLLGEESRLPVRRMLCDMIIAMGQGSTDGIGRFAEDQRWYLGRNVAYILGRLGDTRGIPYVGRLAAHYDHRVRSEAAAALARIGGPDADAQLAKMLRDTDDRVRLKAVLSLSDGGVILARDTLIALLEQPDPFQRHFHIKQEIVTVLARAGVEDALPVLTRIARRRFGFGWRARALRTVAADAVDEIKGKGHTAEPPSLTVSVQAGGR